MERRDFIKKAGTGSIALSASPLLLGNSAGWKSANDIVKVAVIGIHGMGQNHIKSYQKQVSLQLALAMGLGVTLPTRISAMGGLDFKTEDTGLTYMTSSANTVGNTLDGRG